MPKPAKKTGKILIATDLLKSIYNEQLKAVLEGTARLVDTLPKSSTKPGKRTTVVVPYTVDTAAELLEFMKSNNIPGEAVYYPGDEMETSAFEWWEDENGEEAQREG